RKLGDQIQEGHDPRGQPFYWIGSQWVDETFYEGTDLAAVYAGAVSITPLSIDLTDTRMMKVLKGVFK
ncbi:MAG: 5'/3'-nucleotidase SurE, partial [Rhodospirillales bacterium]|nr:5'/3'-nucleotidase SurE [Rhodospirillales bacterium]